MSAMFALLLDVTTIFVLAAWLLSGAGALMPLPAAPPARSREALRLALLPAVGGGLVVLAALSPSVRTWIDGGQDHCGGGTAHPHLCWLHAAPGALAWHDVIIAIVAAALAVAVFWRLGAWVLAAHRLHAVVRSADRARCPAIAEALRVAGSAFPGAIRVVPTDAPLCFVAGVRRPTLVVSTRVVEALSARDLAVVAAHEAAHVRRRDPAIRLVVTLAAVVHAPGLGRRAARRWAAAAELACDDDAARAVGDRIAVAEALVRFQRLVNVALASSPVPRPAIPFGGDAGLDARVRAMLAPPAAGAAWLRAWPWAAAAALACQADQIHALLEWVLGTLHG